MSDELSARLKKVETERDDWKNHADESIAKEKAMLDRLHAMLESADSLVMLLNGIDCQPVVHRNPALAAALKRLRDQVHEAKDTEKHHLGCQCDEGHPTKHATTDGRVMRRFCTKCGLERKPS